MEGTIKVLKEGFGFIEESVTKKFWYFRFQDLTAYQAIREESTVGELAEFLMVREGFKVQFEKKESSKEFEDKLNKGFLRDININHRNPRPRHPLAPAATNIEVIAGQESR